MSKGGQSGRFFVSLAFLLTMIECTTLGPNFISPEAPATPSWQTKDAALEVNPLAQAPLLRA